MSTKISDMSSSVGDGGCAGSGSGCVCVSWLVDGGESGSVEVNEVMVRDVVYVREKCLCSIKSSSIN